jgi:hypothetical protein
MQVAILVTAAVEEAILEDVKNVFLSDLLDQPPSRSSSGVALREPKPWNAA